MEKLAEIARDIVVREGFCALTTSLLCDVANINRITLSRRVRRANCKRPGLPGLISFMLSRAESQADYELLARAYQAGMPISNHLRTIVKRTHPDLCDWADRSPEHRAVIDLAKAHGLSALTRDNICYFAGKAVHRQFPNNAIASRFVLDYAREFNDTALLERAKEEGYDIL